MSTTTRLTNATGRGRANPSLAENSGGAAARRRKAAVPAGTPGAQTDPAQPVKLMQAPADGVTVRMYRQGLGDCFLLAFPAARPDQSYYVLIDCGVIKNTPQSTQRMTEVAAHIQASTGGHIHLLVVTHRHWDHICGFKQAHDIFDEMQIDNLWLPWLENRDDPAARKIWGDTAQALTALTNAVSRAPAVMPHVAALFGFFGDNLELAAADGDPLAPIKALLDDGQQPTWCHPNDGPLALPSGSGLTAPGVQVYVFGPPSDLADIRKMNPSKGAAQETYLGQPGLATHLAFSLGILPAGGQSDEQERLINLSFPFDEHLQIKPEDARQIEFFQSFYGFAAEKTGDAPAAPQDTGPSSATTTAAGGSAASDAGSTPAAAADAAGGNGAAVPATAQPGVSAAEDGAVRKAEAWRRIDDDWTIGAEELALQIDNVVNNTSLVLAFEFAMSKKVLFFAADAQVGNWLSWEGLEWRRADGSTVTPTDLFKHTVLYKVGHHGSHNATVKQLTTGQDWGIALMTHPDLAAMVPVDELIACQQSGQWEMPNPLLLPHILAATRGRILRVDQGLPQMPADADPAMWRSFVNQVKPAKITPYPVEERRSAISPDPLYIDYTITE